MKHERGVVSTVSIPGKANSEGAQFFVCVSPQPALDGKFSTFGRVTEGIDVVEKISQVAADANGITEKPVRILKVTIEKKREEPFVNATMDELRKTVTLKTTLGNIKIKMEPDWAPENVRNFLKLTQTGWYNGTVFHRISKDFVVQGGAPAGRASGPNHYADRWVRPAEGRVPNRCETRARRHIHGAWRRSEFRHHFVLPDARCRATSLDGQFSAFGRIVEGLDVLDAFAKEDVDGETPKRRLELVDASDRRKLSLEHGQRIDLFSRHRFQRQSGPSPRAQSTRNHRDVESPPDEFLRHANAGGVAHACAVQIHHPAIRRRFRAIAD